AAALNAEGAPLGIRLVRRGDASAFQRIPRQPVGHLVVREEELLRALRRQPGRRLARRERRLDDPSLRVVDGCRGRRGESGGGDRRSSEKRARDGKETRQCLLRNDHSLLPRKFSGVTSTTAIACETIFPRPASTKSVSSTRFAP